MYNTSSNVDESKSIIFYTVHEYSTQVYFYSFKDIYDFRELPQCLTWHAFHRNFYRDSLKNYQVRLGGDK